MKGEDKNEGEGGRIVEITRESGKELGDGYNQDRLYTCLKLPKRKLNIFFVKSN